MTGASRFALLFYCASVVGCAARELFKKARLFITPHGAALTNMIFLPVNASVLEMRPRGWSAGCYRQLATVCSLQYYLSWGEGEKGSKLKVNLIDLRTQIEHIRSLMFLS